MSPFTLMERLMMNIWVNEHQLTGYTEQLAGWLSSQTSYGATRLAWKSSNKLLRVFQVWWRSFSQMLITKRSINMQGVGHSYLASYSKILTANSPGMNIEENQHGCEGTCETPCPSAGSWPILIMMLQDEVTGPHIRVRVITSRVTG